MLINPDCQSHSHHAGPVHLVHGHYVACDLPNGPVHAELREDSVAVLGHTYRNRLRLHRPANLLDGRGPKDDLHRHA